MSRSTNPRGPHRASDPARSPAARARVHLLRIDYTATRGDGYDAAFGSFTAPASENAEPSLSFRQRQHQHHHTMPAKRKPAPTPAGHVRPVGRPADPTIDRRRARTVSLPESIWQRLDYVTTTSGAASLSAIVETYLTTKAHLPRKS